MPVQPRAINAPDGWTGQPGPGRFVYPTSYNLPGSDSRVLPWKVLRDAADSVDLVRRCIEVRKAELRGYEWDIVVAERALEQARRDRPGQTDVQLGQALRDEMSDEIARLRDWWEMPDRSNGLDFNSWVSQALEEHLVLDALAIWPRRTRGGDLFSLEVLDGRLPSISFVSALHSRRSSRSWTSGETLRRRRSLPTSRSSSGSPAGSSPLTRWSRATST